MSKKEHMTSIGGQAVLEGVMMRGPKKTAVSIRKSDGEIILDTKETISITAKLKLSKIPIVRGFISFFDSLYTGMKYTMYSAEFVDLEDEEETESKLDQFLMKLFGDKIMDVLMWVSVILALILGVGLFMLLPTVLAGFFKDMFTNATFIKFPAGFVNAVSGVFSNTVVLNLIESVTRMLIFLLYMYAVSHLNEMKRVFAYHGAEHKTIACYEAGEELTIENVRKYTRLHPRCGTSFLLIVMVVSILFFSFLTWDNVFMRLIIRLALLPVVAGVSYEVIKFAGRSKCGVARLLTKPGLALQKLTTQEPDDEQIEVAIAALTAVLPQEGEDDKW